MISPPVLGNEDEQVPVGRVVQHVPHEFTNQCGFLGAI